MTESKSNWRLTEKGWEQRMLVGGIFDPPTYRWVLIIPVQLAATTGRREAAATE